MNQQVVEIDVVMKILRLLLIHLLLLAFDSFKGNRSWLWLQLRRGGLFR